MYYISLILLLVVCTIYFSRPRRRDKFKHAPQCERMDPVSASLLLSEVDPMNFGQVHIVSLIVFEERISYADFRNSFVDNIVLSDKDSRFSYRLACSFWEPSKWLKASDWHPFDNCRCVEEPQTLATSKLLVSERLTEPLNISKPLWEMQFIDTFLLDSGEAVSAMVLTIHHSMGDGFTLCHQMMRRSMPSETGFTMKECYPFEARDQTPVGYSPVSLLKTGFRICSTAVKLLLMTPDPVSALRNSRTRKLSDKIITEMVELQFSVDEIKGIAKKAELALSVSDKRIFLNDVIVAVISLALGPLLEKKHDVTSAIWVALNRKSVMERPRERQHEWGNSNLGTCYLKLPTAESDPLKVLLKCHDRLAQLKRSPEPFVANKILKLLGSLPMRLLWPFRNILLDKMSVSISNFPGPVHPIRFPVAPDGTLNTTLKGVGTVKSAFFSVAPPFSYGPYFTLLSYDGKIFMSISVAERLMNQHTLSDLVLNRIPNSVRFLDKEIQSLIDRAKLI